MNEVMSGALVVAQLVASLFFLRFWKRTGELLFVFFAVAFFILAAQRLALALATDSAEDNVAFYVPRLLAFLIILAGIWHKNVADHREP